jgi:hypothetical protein
MYMLGNCDLPTRRALLDAAPRTFERLASSYPSHAGWRRDQALSAQVGN